MTDALQGTPTRGHSMQDRLILLLIRFFRAEWSGALLAIVVLGIAIEFATTDTMFFMPSNLMTILNNSAPIGVVAAGMTLVILTAGIDLSVGSVMGLAWSRVPIHLTAFSTTFRGNAWVKTG